MNIECDNCGGSFNSHYSLLHWWRVGAGSIRCPECNHYVQQDLHKVKRLLFISITIATAVSVVLPILFVLVASLLSGHVSITKGAYFVLTKGESFGSIILLLNFIVVFLGLSVPGIVKGSGTGKYKS
ncbi:hypothetical protein [Teredinibacter haidensis]|uniref:hypothetical protein n=1 Tax=Teredinibacter haidensis TaxID=2731755 RepID=UPI000948EE28|nr:hypothetical protein [Teredinibacter haidensis]